MDIDILYVGSYVPSYEMSLLATGENLKPTQILFAIHNLSGSTKFELVSPGYNTSGFHPNKTSIQLVYPKMVDN